MADKKKVLITGASGLIGGLIRKNLGDKYDFSALNRSKVEGIPCVQADIADAEGIKPAFEGIHTVVHLAAFNEGVYNWEGNLRISIGGTRNVYEAARIHGVKRIVFASSGGTTLGYETESPYTEIVAAEYDKVPKVWPLITDDMPPRPNSDMYVAKVFGEVLGRMYSDMYGISVLNVRVGAVLPDDIPLMRRHYPGYFAHEDVVQMFDKCIDAPDHLRYEIFEGLSDNRWRWRDITLAQKLLGYHPTGSAENHEIEDKGGRHQVNMT